MGTLRASRRRCTLCRHRAILLVRPVPGSEYLELLKGAGATFLRVNFSLLLAAAWTIPVGVASARSPNWRGLRSLSADRRLRSRHRALPCRAVAVDPARRRPRIDPSRSCCWARSGTSCSTSSRRHGHPHRPQRSCYALPLLQLRPLEKLILPGIFPFLVTGMVTASGGAWNASIMPSTSPPRHDLHHTRPRRADHRRHRERRVPHHPA